MNFSAERLSESYSTKFLDERKLRVASPAKGLLAAIQVMLTSAAPAMRRSFGIQCKQSVVNAGATVTGWRRSSSLTHQLSFRKGGDFLVGALRRTGLTSIDTDALIFADVAQFVNRPDGSREQQNVKPE